MDYANWYSRNNSICLLLISQLLTTHACIAYQPGLVFSLERELLPENMVCIKSTGDKKWIVPKYGLHFHAILLFSDLTVSNSHLFFINYISAAFVMSCWKREESFHSSSLSLWNKAVAVFCKAIVISSKLWLVFALIFF